MEKDKDTGNISKDGLTGLKSKAYFLVSLEQSINELALPNSQHNTGLVAVYMSKAETDAIVGIAELIDRQTDYATHYKTGNDEVIAGVCVETPADITQKLHAQLAERFPKLRFGVAHRQIQADSEAEKELEGAAQDAYDAMLSRPAP